jgi:hypothetical protein
MAKNTIDAMTRIRLGSVVKEDIDKKAKILCDEAQTWNSIATYYAEKLGIEKIPISAVKTSLQAWGITDMKRSSEKTSRTKLVEAEQRVAELELYIKRLGLDIPEPGTVKKEVPAK